MPNHQIFVITCEKYQFLFNILPLKQYVNKINALHKVLGALEKYLLKIEIIRQLDPTLLDIFPTPFDTELAGYYCSLFNFKF